MSRRVLSLTALLLCAGFLSTAVVAAPLTMPQALSPSGQRIAAVPMVALDTDGGSGGSPAPVRMPQALNPSGQRVPASPIVLLNPDGTAATPSASPANPTATIGATAVNGSASTFMRSDAAPALPSTLPNLNLGTPTGGVMTNVTGTASGLTAGHVTTNANLTGDVTSVGNATTLANIPAISGANLTNLNASSLASGTVAAARGGAGAITGALKGNGAGVVSQAACADLSNGGTGCSATIANYAALAAANTFTAAQTVNTNTASAPSPISGAGVLVNAADGATARIQAMAYGAIAAFTTSRANGTAASPTGLVSNDQIGGFNSYGWTSAAALAGPAASIRCYATETWSATANGTKCAIATTANTTTTLSDKLTVDQDGSVTAAGIASFGNVNVTSTTIPANAGIYAGAASQLNLSSGGSSRFTLTSSGLASNASCGPQILSNVTGTATVPVIYNCHSDNTSGVGGASGHVAIIAGSTNQIDCVVTGCTHALAAVFSSTIVASGTITGNAGFSMATGQSFALRTGTTYFTSPSAAYSQLGLQDAAAPVAQTLGVQNVVAGTTDTSGADFTIQLSRGTGTGLGGSLVINGAPHSTTGSTQNAVAAVLTLNGDSKLITTGGTVVSGTGSSFRLQASAASATVPTLIVNNTATTTGWGAQASGNISGIVAGTEVERITSTGAFVASGFNFGDVGRGYFSFSANGVLGVFNTGGTDFTRLSLGGTTSSFPAIARSGTAVQIQLGDGSGRSALEALTGGFTSTVTATAFIPTGSSVPANGMYLSASNVIDFATNSIDRVQINSTGAMSNQSATGWRLNPSGVSSTVPSISPHSGDSTTGIGAQASGNMSMIVGGVEKWRWTSTGPQAVTLPTDAAESAVCTTTGAGGTLSTAAAAACTGVSDALLKHDLTSLKDGVLDRIASLDPSRWHYNVGVMDGGAAWHYGMTAQDIARAFPAKQFPDLVNYRGDGTTKAYDWQAFTTGILTKGVIELNRKTDDGLADLQRQIDDLKRQLGVANDLLARFAPSNDNHLIPAVGVSR